MGISFESVYKAWMHKLTTHLKEYGGGNPQLPESAKGLNHFSEVKSIQRGGIQYKSYRKRHFHLDPPWIALPIPYGSMGWRMGGGEDYMTEWHEFWEQLSDSQRSLYFQYHCPPGEWKEWAKRLKEKKG
jgi:hypothetical protein